jgi:GTPase SAR1 family protein
MNFIITYVISLVSLIIFTVFLNGANIIFWDSDISLFNFNLDYTTWNIPFLIVGIVFVAVVNVILKKGVEKSSTMFGKFFIKKSVPSEDSNKPITFLEETAIGRIPAGFNLRRNGISLKVDDKYTVYPDVYVTLQDTDFKLDINCCSQITIDQVGEWYTNSLSKNVSSAKVNRLIKSLKKYSKQYSLDIDGKYIFCMLYCNDDNKYANVIANNTILFISESIQLYVYSFLDGKMVNISADKKDGLKYYVNLNHNMGEKVKQLVDYTITVELDTAISDQLLKCPVCGTSNEYYGVAVTTASGNPHLGVGSLYDSIKDYITIEDGANKISTNQNFDELNDENAFKSVILKIVQDTNIHLNNCKTYFVGNKDNYVDSPNTSDKEEFIRYAIRYAYGHYNVTRGVYEPFETLEDTKLHCENIMRLLRLDNLTLEEMDESKKQTIIDKIKSISNSPNLNKQFIDYISITKGSQHYEKDFHHLCCRKCLYQLPITLKDNQNFYEQSYDVQNKYINYKIMLVGTPNSGKTVLLNKLIDRGNIFTKNQGIDTYYQNKIKTLNTNAEVYNNKIMPNSTNKEWVMPNNYINSTINGIIYTLNLKDSAGENAETILKNADSMVYLIDTTKPTDRQFQILNDNINNLIDINSKRMYKIYIVFTKSDMIDFNFQSIDYSFDNTNYNFEHSQSVRSVFLSSKVSYKPRDIDYYNTCFKHLLNKLPSGIIDNVTDMDVSNVDINSLEKALLDANCNQSLVSDLIAIKNSYDNYDTDYNQDTLRNLSSNIIDFEDTIYSMLIGKSNIKVVVSYNAISSLEKYTPIWVDNLFDCNELTRDRFHSKKTLNNPYQKLIKDIYEVMIKCNDNDSFSREIYPEIDGE